MLDNILNLIDNGDYSQAKILLKKILDSSDKFNKEIVKYLGLVNLNLNLYDEAYDNFYLLTCKCPEDILSFYYLGIVYDSKNENVKAQECYLKVIDNLPDYLPAYKSFMVSCLKQKEYSRIINIESSVLAINEKDAQVFSMIAIAFYETGNFAKALEYYNYSLEQDANNVKTLNQLANTYISLNNTDLAIKTYKKAVKFDNESGLSAYNLGMLYMSLNEFKNAYNMLKLAYKRDNNHIYLSSFALSCLALFKWKEAIKHFETLVGLFPEDNTFSYNLACAYLGDKKYSKGITILERLYALYPKSVTVIKRLAVAYFDVENYKASCNLYKILMQASPFDIELYYEYAILCVKIFDFDTAEEILKKILLIEPNNALFHKDLAIVFLSRKMFDKAKDEFKTAYKLSPDNPLILFEYANYFHIMSDFKSANKFYSKILKLDKPISASMLSAIAVNYIALNMKNKALELLLEANRIEPQNHNVLFNLGRVYFMLNKLDIAKAFIEDAYSIDPNIESANLLAQLYFETELYSEALNLFRIIQVSSPNNISILLYLAKCCLKLNDVKNAKLYLDKILDIFPENDDAMQVYNEIRGSEL